MTRHLITVAVLVVFSGLGLPAGAAEGIDWPCWRGPEHDGISREVGWNANWPGGGPPVLWRANIGVGFGSFAVVGERVYVMGNAGGQETVYCFDAASGKEIWKHAYPADLVANMHEGGPGATPAVSDGKVYTVGKEGALLCLDAANGKVLWASDLRKLTGARKPPAWGFTSSPLIDGDNVVYQAGPTIALDRNSGKPVWRSTEYKPAYSTPAPFDIDGKRGLAVLNSFGLVLLDAATGRELSQYPWKTSFDTNATTPIITGQTVFLSTGYGKGCTLLKIAPGKMQRVYENRSLANHMNTSVVLDEHVYGFDGNTHTGAPPELVCMELATGKENWRQSGMGAGSLLISDNKLLVLSETGELLAAPAKPDAFRPISKAKVINGKCWTVPVLSHARLYLRDAAGDLLCLDLHTP